MIGFKTRHADCRNNSKSNAQAPLAAHKRLTLIAHCKYRVIQRYNALFTDKSRFWMEFTVNLFCVTHQENERYVYGDSSDVQSKEKDKELI